MISGASKIPRKKRKKLWTQTDPVCTFKIISTIPALLSPVSPTGRTKTAITGRQQQIQHAKKGWVPIRRQIQLKWDTADASHILYAATVQQCWHRLCSSKPALAFYLDGRTGPLGRHQLNQIWPVLIIKTVWYFNSVLACLHCFHKVKLILI